MQEEIRKKCDEIRDLLIEKNKSYGNSVFDKGVLFKVDPMYAIQARINDKLNRIKSKETYMSENDLMDLTGYLVLLQVYMDEVDKRMSEAIKSAEPYKEGETPFHYEWTLSEKDETGA
tara:strand:+ start:65 stop:418 length:354 start_codon:yes stop_codon:yes gene_type:complete